MEIVINYSVDYTQRIHKMAYIMCIKYRVSLNSSGCDVYEYTVHTPFRS